MHGNNICRMLGLKVVDFLDLRALLLDFSCDSTR